MSSSEYLILNIGQHHFAANVSNIQDVIRSGNKTPVPLAKKSIGGLLNLRGHIVTEINVSETLGIKKETDTGFSIVINNNDELYSLPFDGIGDVIDVSASDIEPLPETIQRSWHQVAKGVYRMNNQLIVILDLNYFVDMLIENNGKDFDEIDIKNA